MRNLCRYALLAIATASTLLPGFGIAPAVAQLREAALGVWVEEYGEA